MLRRGGRGGKRLVEKGDADAFHAADFFERDRRPEPALDHFGKESQPHGDDFAILSKPSDGLIEEGGLVFGTLDEVVWQATVGPPKGSQHLAGVKVVEQIDGGAVLPLNKID